MPFHTENTHTISALANLEEIYLFRILLTFAGSMLSIFSVIYLFSTVKVSLLEIILFYTLYSCIFIFLAPLGATFAARFGVKKSLLIGVLLYLLVIASYHLLAAYPFILFGIPLLSALHAMFYWPAMHIDFAHSLLKGHEGRELGFLYAMSTLTGVGGAALGGFLYANYGPWAMFLIAAIAVIISIIPLLLTKDVHEPFSLSYRELIEYSTKPGYWKKNVVWASHAIQTSILTIFWPLYIFLVLGSIWGVAWLTALTIFITMFVMLVFGRLVDQWNRWATLRIAAFFNLLVWLSRIFVFNPVSIAIADAFGRSAGGSVQVSIQSIAYKRARRKDQVSFLMRRELFHHLGKIFVLVLFAAVIAFLGESYLFFAFVLAAVACLGYFLIY